MNRKVKASLKRVFVVLFAIILLFGSVSFYPPLQVYAEGDWTAAPGTGTTVDTPPSGGSGSGHPSTSFCRSVDCVMFSFWENSGSGKTCVGCIIQPFNSSSSMYSNIEYANGIADLRQLVDATGSVSLYLNSVCRSGNTAPAGIPIYITYNNRWVQSVNSNKHLYGAPSAMGPTFGNFPYPLDSTIGYKRSTPATRYALTQVFLSTSQPGATIVSTFNSACGTSYVLNTNISMGVSEIALQVMETYNVTGCCFPSVYNVMGVAESGGDIFPAGQNACFTYLGGTNTNAICTYDVNNNPDHPANAEDPCGIPEKQGEYKIHKIYWDLTTGSVQTFDKTSVCPAIIIDDERGKIGSAWSFSGWKPSASALGKNSFTTGVYNTTGMIDARSYGKVINLLFVKRASFDDSVIEITEQSLGLGTTNTYGFIALNGKDEAGYKVESNGSCSYQTGTKSCNCGNNHGLNGGPGHSSSCTQGDPIYCGATLYKWTPKTATRTVTYSWSPFFAAFTSGTGSNSGVSSGATNDSGAADWKYSITPSSTLTNYSHPTHEASGSATLLLQNAILNTTGFAVYRHYGLNDNIAPLFTNSAFTLTDPGLLDYVGSDFPFVRVGDGSFGIYSGAYNLALGSSNSRHGAGSGWTLFSSAGGYGSTGYSVTIPKTTGASGTVQSALNINGADRPTSLSEATTDVAKDSAGNNLLNTIEVWSYLANPNITPAEYGDRLEYNVSVKPIVVMRLPYAQELGTGKPAQYDNAANLKRAAYVLVGGQYNRTLHLSSIISVQPRQLDGIVVTPNTQLNDARVSQYLIDDIGWSSSTAPYPIPGGSTIFVGQSSAASQSNSNGAAGYVEVTINTPFIGRSPLKTQIEDSGESFFKLDNNPYLDRGSAMCQWTIDDAKDWTKRYLGESCSDDTYYTGGQCIDQYINDCVTEMTKVYLALYVYDTVDKESFDLSDGKLFKVADGITPTGFITGGKFTLDSTQRTAHTDEKYSFGGIGNHTYMRITRDLYPETQFSFAGIDTCGGAYTVSGGNFHWSMPFDGSFALTPDNIIYIKELWEALGCPATAGELRAAVRAIDKDTDPDTIRTAYECGCAVSIAGFCNGPMRKVIYDGYVTQYPVYRGMEERGFVYTAYAKDGGLWSNDGGGNIDGTLSSRALQLSNSVEHDVGNDTTWYADGDWYNEGVLPYYVVNTIDKLTLYFPSNSSTIIDTSLMGLSTGGKDEMFKGDANSWNGAVVSFAFDGMTASEFDNGVELTLPNWGTNAPTVELSEIGVSHPMAISNTDVSDIC